MDNALKEIQEKTRKLDEMEQVGQQEIDQMLQERLHAEKSRLLVEQDIQRAE